MFRDQLVRASLYGREAEVKAFIHLGRKKRCPSRLTIDRARLTALIVEAELLLGNRGDTTMSIIRHPIWQYAYFVEDIDEACHKWHKMMGAGPFTVVRHHIAEDFRYKGEHVEAESVPREVGRAEGRKLDCDPIPPLHKSACHGFLVRKQGVEQALILDTKEGPVLLTGCAHPGIILMAERAMELSSGPLHSVMGGFHLMNATEPELETIVSGFQRLGVQSAGATHCSGDPAVAAFREAYGQDFMDLGAGRVLRFPLNS